MLEYLIANALLNGLATAYVYPWKDSSDLGKALFNINGVFTAYYVIRIIDALFI